MLTEVGGIDVRQIGLIQMLPIWLRFIASVHAFTTLGGQWQRLVLYYHEGD